MYHTINNSVVNAQKCHPTHLHPDLFGCVPLPQSGSVGLECVKVYSDPKRNGYLVCPSIAPANGATAVIHLVGHTMLGKGPCYKVQQQGKEEGK